MHELGAFKWRGALPVLTAYRERGATTVVTASTGNHGAATAWAADRLGLTAVVYAPEGADLDEANEAARGYAADAGIPFFEDGAEALQYEGYGAVAGELLDQLGAPPAAVVVPVGNGALLGGVGMQLGARAPDTIRIGVAAKEAPVMAECWQAGTVVTSDRSATFADGLAVRVAIPLAVNVLGEVASRMLLVSEREIAQAVGRYAAAGLRVEGAAGAALAALPQLEDVDGVVVLIVTGRNIDDELYARACERPESFSD